MSTNFINLSNKITKMTDEVFGNDYGLPEGANKNAKIFLILDNEEKLIQQVYERINDICRNVHDFTYRVYHISNKKDIKDDMFNLIDGNNMVDVIFVLQNTDNIQVIINKLYEKIIETANFMVKLPLNFVRLAFFRIFNYQKDDPKNLTAYYRSETSKLAGILNSHFSDGTEINTNLFVGTRIYNYLLKADNVDFECLNFAEKVYSIVCVDALMRSGVDESDKFMGNDCPWYTFKVRKMYIPEYILVYSLAMNLKEIFFADREVFGSKIDQIIMCARTKILKKLKKNSLNELDIYLDDYAGFVPVNIDEKEFEGRTRKESKVTRKGLKILGITIIPEEKDPMFVADYNETPLNTDKDILLDIYMESLDKMLPVEDFFTIVFDSFDMFIDIFNENDYDLVKNLVENIIDGIFKTEGESQSEILKKLKSKFKSKLDDHRFFQSYCDKVRDTTGNVYRELVNIEKTYDRYIVGLTAAIHPARIPMNISLHDLTNPERIYEQLIEYLNDNIDAFRNNWTTQTNYIVPELSLNTDAVVLPLASGAEAGVIANNQMDIPLSEFEKKINRGSRVYFVKCDSIDELKFGIFDN